MALVKEDREWMHDEWPKIEVKSSSTNSGDVGRFAGEYLEGLAARGDTRAARIVASARDDGLERAYSKWTRTERTVIGIGHDGRVVDVPAIIGARSKENGYQRRLWIYVPLDELIEHANLWIHQGRTQLEQGNTLLSVASWVRETYPECTTVEEAFERAGIDYHAFNLDELAL